MALALALPYLCSDIEELRARYAVAPSASDNDSEREESDSDTEEGTELGDGATGPASLVTNESNANIVLSSTMVDPSPSSVTNQSPILARGDVPLSDHGGDKQAPTAVDPMSHLTATLVNDESSSAAAAAPPAPKRSRLLKELASAVFFPSISATAESSSSSPAASNTGAGGAGRSLRARPSIGGPLPANSGTATQSVQHATASAARVSRHRAVDAEGAAASAHALPANAFGSADAAARVSLGVGSALSSASTTPTHHALISSAAAAGDSASATSGGIRGIPTSSTCGVLSATSTDGKPSRTRRPRSEAHAADTAGSAVPASSASPGNSPSRSRGLAQLHSPAAAAGHVSDQATLPSHTRSRSSSASSAASFPGHDEARQQQQQQSPSRLRGAKASLAAGAVADGVTAVSSSSISSSGMNIDEEDGQQQQYTSVATAASSSSTRVGGGRGGGGRGKGRGRGRPPLSSYSTTTGVATAVRSDGNGLSASSSGPAAAAIDGTAAAHSSGTAKRVISHPALSTMSLPAITQLREDLLRRLHTLRREEDDHIPQLYWDYTGRRGAYHGTSGDDAAAMGGAVEEEGEGGVSAAPLPLDQQNATAAAASDGSSSSSTNGPVDAAVLASESAEFSAVGSAGGAGEPPRKPKPLWDYMLEEAGWLSNDFAAERKWKVATAKKLGAAVLAWHARKAKKIVEEAVAGACCVTA